MDAEQLRRLGFACQVKCRVCRVNLVIGENWFSYDVKTRKRLCKKCRNKSTHIWREGNQDKIKIYEFKRIRNITRRFYYSKCKAKRRGVSFNLTIEQYVEKISKPCHYCDYPLNPTSVGLDQIIPGEGYSTTSVPCCKECNMVKSNILTYEQMLIVGKMVKENKDKRKKEKSSDFPEK